MKTKLAPEPERAVTPGPKAVEDLESLETPSHDHVVLQNLEVFGPDGKVAESYPRLLVERSTHQWVRDLTIYSSLSEVILAGEQEECFLPSAALTCAMLVQLYERRDEPLCSQVLGDYVSIYAPLAQNTIIDWPNGIVIHYPIRPMLSAGADINIDRPRRIYELGRAADRPRYPVSGNRFSEVDSDFMRKLTGLKDPGKLDEIAAYLTRPPDFICPEIPVLYRAYSGVCIGGDSLLTIRLLRDVESIGEVKYVRGGS